MWLENEKQADEKRDEYLKFEPRFQTSSGSDECTRWCNAEHDILHKEFVII
jgi:hypothetical protein